MQKPYLVWSGSPSVPSFASRFIPSDSSSSLSLCPEVVLEHLFVFEKFCVLGVKRQRTAGIFVHPLLLSIFLDSDCGFLRGLHSRHDHVLILSLILRRFMILNWLLRVLSSVDKVSRSTCCFVKVRSI